jgi:hypothetical protein
MSEILSVKLKAIGDIVQIKSVLTVGIVAVLFVVLDVRASSAQTYEPAVDYASLLNMKFYDNGTFHADDVNLAFAPEGGADASVEVLDAEGKVLSSKKYFSDYVYTAKSFGRLRVDGPADMQVTAPGNYVLQYTINDKLSTRLPFSVKVSGSGDPFDTAKKFRYDGPWCSLGYIVMRPYKETMVPHLFLWTGVADLKPDAKKDQLIAKVFRDGKMVAHSKRSAGAITNEHYRRSVCGFFAPHEDRRAYAAAPFTREQLLTNGKYNIRIERQSDNALLRNFVFTVADGQVQQLPRSVVGFQPNADFLVPRVPVFGSSTYEFEPAIWIADPTR